MTAGGNRLLVRRRNGPGTTVDGTTFLDGFDLDYGAINFFTGLKLLFVCIDRILGIKATAYRLACCGPACKVLRSCRRNVGIDTSSGRSNQRKSPFQIVF